jgi:hypothetical protein
MDATTPAVFHANCDAYSTTLTVAHNAGGTFNDGRRTVTNSGNKIFGGYAVGSWSQTACCAVPGNECRDHPMFGGGSGDCIDHSASADFVFGRAEAHPGPPTHYPATGNDDVYQYVDPAKWPKFGKYGDLWIGSDGAPGGDDGRDGYCHPSSGHGTFQPSGAPWICGGSPWGQTHVEVWRPAGSH